MIKLRAVSILLLFIFTAAIYAQDESGYRNLPNSPVELKLKNNPESDYSLSALNRSLFNKNDAPTGLFAGLIFLTFINPVIVFEDKKIFWGLTKEISKSFYPYGRVSFEYSFLFRTFNKNHFRFSYNYDHVFQNRSDWLMFTLSPGAGFFTDTEKNGVFVQGSGGVFFPTPIFVAHLYLKYRFTNVFDKNMSDIHDISLGMGLVF